MCSLNLAQKSVELAGRDALVPRLQGATHSSGQAIRMPSGLSRQIHALGPRHAVKLGLPQAFHALTIEIIHQIPLVEYQDNASTGIHGLTHHLQILIGDRLGGVEQHQCKLRTLNRGLRTQRREILGAGQLVQATLDAGGIDEQPILAIDGDDLIDRISRGARKIVDDGAFLVGQLIEQGGFADVRTSDQSHARSGR